MEAPERLERLLHEILHNLQVIRMEAELRKKARSERISLGVLDATKDIEKLLEEVKTKFHALSMKLAVKAPGIDTVHFIEPMYALAVQNIPTVRSGSTK